MSANRKYKDSVFSKYFSEDPKRLVELYNALEGTNYPEDTPVKVNTITDVLYKDRLNDLSFLLDGQLVVLIEHQSTINNNMALRMLIYLGRLYEQILPSDALYRSKLIKIPTPKFIVLYNGLDDCPDHYQQRLSTAFSAADDEPSVELVVDVWNVNFGENERLAKESKSLYDYSYFVHCVRQWKSKGLEVDDAIARAIQECVKANIMKEFLSKHGSEVENMLFTEWNWDTALKVQKEEGEEEGVFKALCRAVYDGVMKRPYALSASNSSESEFMQWMHKFYPDYKA